MSEVISMLTLLFAAAVGSGFYTLSTAQRYIQNRTFNPQFNQIYVMRFIVGVVAGTIIGTMVALNINGFSSVGMAPAIAAIVGGYSAEVVQQILTRLAEALLTVVKGSPTDQGELAYKQAQAELASDRAQDKVETAKLLADLKLEISNVRSDDASRAAALKKLDKAIDALSSGGR